MHFMKMTSKDVKMNLHKAGTSNKHACCIVQVYGRACNVLSSFNYIPLYTCLILLFQNASKNVFLIHKYIIKILMLKKIVHPKIKKVVTAY